MKNFIFTSESVAEGHPDKVCDQISDAILDAYLALDPSTRVAVETVVAPNRVIILGEIKDPKILSLDSLKEVVKDKIRQIGYESPNFDWKRINIEIALNAQSPDIAQGLRDNEGAGDQGMMFGYACRENEAFMPTPIYFAQNFLQSIAEDRKKGILEGLGPDGKCQFSIEYCDYKPIKTTAIVASCQHREELKTEDVKHLIRPYIDKLLPEGWFCGETSFHVNPTGRFVIGGPESDTGLTGRKIIVDTYGGMAPHGGGAFSGKDPTKVDRSAAYIARYMAKNIVASGLAERCTIQLSYAIGRADPTSFYINMHGTGLINEDRLSMVLRDLLDLTPRGIRKTLGLERPIYARTAVYGHFGRKVDSDGGFSWENLDLVDELRNAFL